MSTPLGSSWRSRCLESSLQEVSSQKAAGKRRAVFAGRADRARTRTPSARIGSDGMCCESGRAPEARGLKPVALEQADAVPQPGGSMSVRPHRPVPWQPLDARAAGACHVLGRAHERAKERTPEHPLEHLRTLPERAGRENSASVVRGVMAPQQRSASRPATGCVERGNRPRIRVFGLEGRDGCLSVWRVAARSPWTAGRRP